jgi:hypothetical protein
MVDTITVATEHYMQLERDIVALTAENRYMDEELGRKDIEISRLEIKLLKKEAEHKELLGRHVELISTEYTTKRKREEEAAKNAANHLLSISKRQILVCENDKINVMFKMDNGSYRPYSGIVLKIIRHVKRTHVAIPVPTNTHASRLVELWKKTNHAIYYTKCIVRYEDNATCEQGLYYPFQLKNAFIGKTSESNHSYVWSFDK